MDDDSSESSARRWFRRLTDSGPPRASSILGGVAAAAVGLAVVLTAASAGADQAPSPNSTSTSEATDGADERIEQFNRRRIQRERRGMATLGAWSAVNIGVGTAGALTTDGATRQFHLMNAGWNVVNAAIAALGYARASGQDPAQPDLLESLDYAQDTEQILLFNAGLNVAYITAGAALWDRGRRTGSDQLRGWGPSVMLQGAFLLGLDTTLYVLSRRHRSDFQLEIGPVAPAGVSATVRF